MPCAKMTHSIPRGLTKMKKTRGLAALVTAIQVAGIALVYAQPPGPPLPPPLPAPVAPAGNPVTTAKANLGKALFWDEQLSSTGTVSCGTCHQSPRGGSDGRSMSGQPAAMNPGVDNVFGNADDVVGSPGVPLSGADGNYQWQSIFELRPQVTGRKSRSYLDAAYPPELFWDGRAGGTFRDPITNTVVLATGAALESQVLGPPVNTGEMGHAGRDWNNVAATVTAARPLALANSIPVDLQTWIAGRTYPELFNEAFGSPAVTPSRIAMATATYERTLFSNQTPVDLFTPPAPTLTPQEMRGFNVFVGSNCIGCHAGSLFSDDQYHYIGVRPNTEDTGRFEVTANPVDRGAFRTPSLRNVELRGPYFHNGRFNTLEEVVDFYNRGGDFTAPNKDPRIQPLGLNAGQRADLLAFLRRPLTDPRVAAGTFPFDRPSLYTESSHVPVLVGAGTAGQGGFVPRAIAIEPPIGGNANFTVAVRDGLGGAPAILIIDTSDPGPDADIPTSPAIARVTLNLLGSGAGNGYASTSIALPNNTALDGVPLFGRWFILDPAASGGVAASEAFQFSTFRSSGSAASVSDFENY
jgi:cytochrome c peroxidase